MVYRFKSFSSWRMAVFLTCGILVTLLMLPIRLMECSQCAGVAERLQMQGVPIHDALTNCPACHDTGRVSFLRRYLMPQVDSQLRIMIQNPSFRPDAQGPFVRALQKLLQRGTAGATDRMQKLPNTGQARFVTANQSEFIVVIANKYSVFSGGESYGTCCVFDGQGNLLDFMEAYCPPHKGSLFLYYEDNPTFDAAVIRINAEDGSMKREHFPGFELVHDRKTWALNPKSPGWPKDWLTNGVCRLAVTRKGLQILSPELGSVTK